jgi:transcriptional regulator with XRE-family HTH domain
MILSIHEGGLDMAIGDKIKELREKMEISQTAFAKKAGIAQSTVHYIESGVNIPNYKTLEKIAAALEIPVTELSGSKSA